MNRLHHLQQTLPRNLKGNEDYDDIEFIILDYNSTDGLDEWIRDTYSSLIQEGRLVFFQEKTADHFYPSHSRNVSMRCASGDVVCNVDADNFTCSGFATFLYDFFSIDTKPRFANTYDMDLWKDTSTHGRIAMRRQHFFRIGGYDEKFIGWGSEDTDLTCRCINAGFERLEIPKKYFEVIGHGDDDRYGSINFVEHTKDTLDESNYACSYINSERLNWKRENEFLVNNLGCCWGKAVLEKNFSETCELGSPWINL